MAVDLKALDRAIEDLKRTDGGLTEEKLWGLLQQQSASPPSPGADMHAYAMANRSQALDAAGTSGNILVRPSHPSDDDAFHSKTRRHLAGGSRNAEFDLIYSDR
jgi:hypothetical protein